MWEPFLDMAVEYLSSQQARLKSEFQLGSWPRYDYDQEAGTLSFSANGKVEVLADIHIVGSTSSIAAPGSGHGTTLRSWRT